MFKDKTTYLLMLAEGVVNFRLFFPFKYNISIMFQQQMIPTHCKNKTGNLFIITCELTCFCVLVETRVFGKLEQGETLLNGRPDVRLRAQQVRGPVLTLERRKGKRSSSHISGTRTSWLQVSRFSYEQGIVLT